MSSHRAPVVFVSSTCYDLKQVRVDLKSFIEGMGFEALLSEYDSFPVDPSSSTIDNCRKSVEEHADIFVLIVGGRYGTTISTGKSITNIEYLQARAKGIPTYVFIQISILSILPVWKQNPEGNFSNVVDSPALFKFVSSLRDSGEVWTYGFDTAQNITETLRKKWAVLFMDMLKLKSKADVLGLPDSLRELRGPAFRLVVERPYMWKGRLFSQVFYDEVQKVADKRRDLDHDIYLGPVQRYTTATFAKHARDRLFAMTRISESAAVIVNTVLVGALRSDGQAEDPVTIVYAAQRLANCYVAAIDWALAWQAIEVSKDLRDLLSACKRFSSGTIRELEEGSVNLKKQLDQFVAEADRKDAKFIFELSITVEDPEAIELEVERILNLKGLA